ncbi:MAG TPA: carotenoid biosynthesis protein [Anaerolineales bacterium]|nr:carotenoid biosynthesis protein [Anaerolineales bacterium]
MPNPYFLLLEFIIYIQFAICLHHAWKHGAAKWLRLFAGILFGVSLELATIRQLSAYEYGKFLIMILDVPLCIGIAWSCILYASMEFSDASNLPYFVRPVLDGLLALNLDLALDAVAIRLGFWDWGQGLKFQYFGVPYANFWAWFWVIFFFSLGYRIFARRTDWIGIGVSPVSALAIGLAGVLGTNALIAFHIPLNYHSLAAMTVIGAGIVIVLAFRPKFHIKPAPSLVFWIPLLTHLYILIAGLISGTILNPPFLLFVGLVMFAISLYLHSPRFSNSPLR